MYNQTVEYNGKNCLNLALQLLIHVGKLYKCVVNRIMKEEDYKELYEQLEKSRYKERSADSVSNLYRPFRFNACNCLAEAILFLADLEILEHADTQKIIEDESYVAVFTLLESKLHEYESFYCRAT